MRDAMYSYRPASQSSRRMPKSPSISFDTALILMILFVAGVSAINIIKKEVYNKQTRNIVPVEERIYPVYSKKTEKETDVAKLARTGDALLKKSMTSYAALNFKRASDLDPNYRDVAYGWGYALFQSKQHNLSDDDKKQLHTAIERAEAVDPMHVPTLNLKIALAKVENDQTALQAAEARLRLLETQ